MSNSWFVQSLKRLLTGMLLPLFMTALCGTALASIPVPQNLTISKVAKYRYLALWDACEPARDYYYSFEIEELVPNGTPRIVYSSTASTPGFSFSNGVAIKEKPGVEYRINIRAVEQEGGRRSDAATIAYPIIPPKITGVSVSNVRPSFATLSWNRPILVGEGMGYYRISLNPLDSQGVEAQTVTVEGESCTLEGLTGGTNYEVSVTALGHDETSDGGRPSDALRFMTQPSPVVSFESATLNVTEGTSHVMVPISLDKAAERPVRIWVTPSFELPVGGDYGASADSSDVIAIRIPVDFGTDETRKRVPFFITDDTLSEDTESLSLNLSADPDNPVSLSVSGSGSCMVIIADDEEALGEEAVAAPEPQPQTVADNFIVKSAAIDEGHTREGESVTCTLSIESLTLWPKSVPVDILVTHVNGVQTSQSVMVTPSRYGTGLSTVRFNVPVAAGLQSTKDGALSIRVLDGRGYGITEGAVEDSCVVSLGAAGLVPVASFSQAELTVRERDSVYYTDYIKFTNRNGSNKQPHGDFAVDITIVESTAGQTFNPQSFPPNITFMGHTFNHSLSLGESIACSPSSFETGSDYATRGDTFITLKMTPASGMENRGAIGMPDTLTIRVSDMHIPILSVSTTQNSIDEGGHTSFVVAAKLPSEYVSISECSYALPELVNSRYYQRFSLDRDSSSASGTTPLPPARRAWSAWSDTPEERYYVATIPEFYFYSEPNLTSEADAFTLELLPGDGYIIDKSAASATVTLNQIANPEFGLSQPIYTIEDGETAVRAAIIFSRMPTQEVTIPVNAYISGGTYEESVRTTVNAGPGSSRRVEFNVPLPAYTGDDRIFIEIDTYGGANNSVLQNENRGIYAGERRQAEVIIEASDLPSIDATNLTPAIMGCRVQPQTGAVSFEVRAGRITGGACNLNVIVNQTPHVNSQSVGFRDPGTGHTVYIQTPDFEEAFERAVRSYMNNHGTRIQNSAFSVSPGHAFRVLKNARDGYFNN